MDFVPKFAVGYLAHRFVFRITDFFHHWYIDVSRAFLRAYRSYVQGLEQSLAFSTTIKHLFEPLYKDYSIVGRIIGPFFRLGRLAIGGVMYLVVSLIFLLVYCAWAAFPIIVILYTLTLSFP